MILFFPLAFGLWLVWITVVVATYALFYAIYFFVVIVISLALYIGNEVFDKQWRRPRMQPKKPPQAFYSSRR